MAKPTDPPYATARWLLVAGFAAALAAGASIADTPKKERDRLAAAERYWATEVKRRTVVLELADLNRRECLVELLAARMKEPIHEARSKLMDVNSSARSATATLENVCQALTNDVTERQAKLTAAERELEDVREDHRIAAGVIPRHSPSFASAWQTFKPSWAEVVASREYQALNAADKEEARLHYWRKYISPLVPTEELRRARRQFDQLTAGKPRP